MKTAILLVLVTLTQNVCVTNAKSESSIHPPKAIPALLPPAKPPSFDLVPIFHFDCLPTKEPPYQEHAVCEGKREGLVRYPTTLVPASESVDVTSECTDNAHRTSSSLNVSCTSSGNWSGTTPQCQCDTGYRTVAVGGRQICQALLICEARVIGLVHYPTTTAPARGSVTVTTQCADNAHILDTASHNVTCVSDGSWSGQIPQCECDLKYYEAMVNGRHICLARTPVLCKATSRGLVHYPTTLALFNGSVNVTSECADNAHRSSSSLNVSCTSNGTWSGTTPQCQCDTGYHAVTVGGRQICQALLVCEAMVIGLVHYPTATAPASRSVTITTHCADNAHRTSSSLNVSYTSSGNWSGTTPQCQCDTGYRAVIVGVRPICQTLAVTTCPAKSVGLVRYPATLAPVSGSVTVTTQCADNAHVFNSTSLNVTCTSNGSWSGQIPQCQCDEGHHSINVSGTQMCRGVYLKAVQDSRIPSTVYLTSVISFLLLLSLTIVICIIIICGMKLRNKSSDDIGAKQASASRMNAGKKSNDTNKDVPVALNKAYAIHNVSRCIKVSTNEAYGVSNEIPINNEPVYELVK